VVQEDREAWLSYGTLVCLEEDGHYFNDKSGCTFSFLVPTRARYCIPPKFPSKLRSASGRCFTFYWRAYIILPSRSREVLFRSLFVIAPHVCLVEALVQKLLCTRGSNSQSRSALEFFLLCRVQLLYCMPLMWIEAQTHLLGYL
jgi:hypothetical protein